MKSLKELKPASREFENVFSRAAIIKTIDEEKRSVENVVLTEAPVVVMDWYRFEPIREIILIDGVRLPESKKVPLLDSHSRYSTSDVLGSTRNLKPGTLQDGTKAILGTSHLSKTAEREWELIKEEHLDSTSAGYMISREQSVYIEPEAVATVNGKEYRNDYGDGLTLVIRQYTELFENSLLPIGADDRAKLRSKFGSNPDNGNEELTDEQKRQINQIINSNKNHGGTMTDQEKRELEEKLKTEYQSKIDEARKSGGDSEAKRVGGIYAIAGMMLHQVDRSKFDVMAQAKEFASNREKSVEDFSELVYKNVRENNIIKTEDPRIGLTDEEIRSFSFLKAVRAAANNDWSKAGFERAVSDAAREKQSENRGAFTIPADVILAGHFARSMQNNTVSRYAIDSNGKIVKRELSVGTATAGGNLVGTNLVASAFINLLRNVSVMSQTGITMLDGLVGNVAIPKQTAAGTVGWISTEGGDASDTSMTVGQLTLSPKTLGARTTLTRQLLLQSTPAADRLAEQDLILQMALAIDKAIPHGTGSSGQPTGITGTSGVGSVTGTGFNFSKAVEFKKKVKIANAFMGNLAYVSNPTIEADLETTVKFTNGSNAILENGKVAGHKFVSTNQVNSGHMFFGDWSQVILAMWGGLDVIVDGISPNDGNVNIKVFQSVDVGIRQPGAFAYSSDVAFS